MKNRIIRQIQDNIAQYLHDHPDADMQQVRTHFGTPNQIAAACVDEMETNKLLKALRVRRKIVTAVVAGVMAVVIVSLTYIGLRVNIFMQTIDKSCGISFYSDGMGYGVSYITEHD